MITTVMPRFPTLGSTKIPLGPSAAKHGRRSPVSRAGDCSDGLPNMVDEAGGDGDVDVDVDEGEDSPPQAFVAITRSCHAPGYTAPLHPGWRSSECFPHGYLPVLRWRW
ncbi:hypothetical protein ACH41H_30490 [Streptomyces sp. NPDC020800]|uniref:hypothetical protein n=1 Tax=Streptomyces sp. NPDC020800 TaxID=3365092 RepID=UPI0037880BA1